MKKLFTISMMLLAGSKIFAQGAVLDTVVMGPGYSNEIFYSLPNDEQGSSGSYNWQLAFATNLMDASIRVNHALGMSVYQDPNIDSTGFATLDTTGIATWPMLYNSDTSWRKGAFNEHANSANPFDFGWGTYSMTTHDVTGDSVYVVRIAPPFQPIMWLKLFFKKKTSTNDYIFRIAYLDNTFDQVYTVPCATYTSKNFIYAALQTGMIDREPASSTWDITFNRYDTYIPGPGYYPVTGVSSNFGVTVAQASPVDVNAVSYTNYAGMYHTNMTEIGYDWKFFNNGTGQYELVDSTAYFIKLADGNIWKMVFTGFESATGTIMFSKEHVFSDGINELNSTLNSVHVYPNPSLSNATLMFDTKTAGNISIEISDVMGRIVSVENINAAAGFQTHALHTSTLCNGTYFVTVANANEKQSTQLVVAH